MQNRMKHSLLSLLIISAVLFFANVTFAQDSKQGSVLEPTETGGFLIGPVGGINLVTYKTDEFAILNSEPSCFRAQNGSDVCFFAGLSAEIPLGETMQNFIVAEAIYDCKSSKFTGTNNTRVDIPTKVNGNVQPGNITTSETASLMYLLFDLGYKYNFTQSSSPVGPGIQLCVNFGLRMTSDLNKTVTVSAADGTSNSLASKTETATTPAPDPQSIRIGIRGAFTYDIPLTPEWIATPMVGYDFPFTKVDNTDKNWSASSAYGGIAIRYFLGK